jgi:hypothetical protein
LDNIFNLKIIKKSLFDLRIVPAHTKFRLGDKISIREHGGGEWCWGIVLLAQAWVYVVI